MFCKNCGNQLNEGAKFCPQCGQSVSAFQADSGADTARGKDTVQLITKYRDNCRKVLSVKNGNTSAISEQKDMAMDTAIQKALEDSPLYRTEAAKKATSVIATLILFLLTIVLFLRGDERTLWTLLQSFLISVFYSALLLFAFVRKSTAVYIIGGIVFVLVLMSSSNLLTAAAFSIPVMGIINLVATIKSVPDSDSDILSSLEAEIRHDADYIELTKLYHEKYSQQISETQLTALSWEQQCELAEALLKIAEEDRNLTLSEVLDKYLASDVKD